MAEKDKVQQVLKLSADAKALRSEIDQIYADTGKPAPGEMIENLEQMLADGQALKKQIELEKQANELANWLTQPATDPVHGKGARPQPQKKSWGQIVTESAQYKSAVEGRRETMDRVNVKAIHGETDAAGAAFVVPQRGEYVALPFRAFTILDMVNVLPASSDSIEYVEQTTRTNAAAAVPAWDSTQGDFGDKPQSNLVFALRTANVKTIAHYIPASRTILQDAPQLRGLIDTELAEMLREELEDQVLNGDGTGSNLTGILQASGIQTRTQASTGDRGGQTTDNKADALRRAITDIRLELYEVNGIVLNPGDAEDIELLKDSNNDYTVRLYDSATGQLWRVPVAETPAITAGTGLVGNFFLGATLWDRMNTEIRVGEPNDFFLRNAVAILAELRVAFAVKRALAFEKVTFA